jgi:hypothetical protein
VVQGRGRLRSSAVALPTISVLAASMLAGCSGLPGAQRRVCVDANQNVISELQCRQPGGIGRYYYYNGGSGGFSSFGSHISGGSFSSHGSSGGSASAASVGRGGFGGHASGG